MAKMNGPDRLRRVVSNMDHVRESFNERFTPLQLVAIYEALAASEIYEALAASEWDIYPDAWSPRQIREALQGVPPDFDEEGRAVYPMTGARKRILGARRKQRLPRPKTVQQAWHAPAIW